MKKCNKCKKEFEPKDEFDMFCSQDCKEEALADLDKVIGRIYSHMDRLSQR